jgi:hypothetical protein
VLDYPVTNPTGRSIQNRTESEFEFPLISSPRSSDIVYRSLVQPTIQVVFRRQSLNSEDITMLELLLHAGSVDQALAVWLRNVNRQIGGARGVQLLSHLTTDGGVTIEQLVADSGGDRETIDRFIRLLENHLIEQEGRLQFVDESFRRHIRNHCCSITRG